jgi:predicted SprT family Zn-dependent metalloprotease
MTINQAITLTKKMLSEYSELSRWNVTTNRRKKAAAVCNYTYRQIELSMYVIPSLLDSSVKDSIIHEIAHALCPGENHNNVWKRKCIELGGNGQRCYSSVDYREGAKGRIELQEKLAKYTLTCPVCGEKYFKNRRPTKSSSCGKHGTRGYDPKYKLTVTQNY